MFENEFKGKVVLVTGGSRGIGFAAVKGFLAAGAKVYFLSHYEETGAKALAALKEINPDYEVMTKAIDLCDYKAVQELYKEIIAKWGRLDVLVNNAGTDNSTWLTKLKQSEWDAVCNLNMKGPYTMMKYAIPHLIKTKGCIVNTASGRRCPTAARPPAVPRQQGCPDRHDQVRRLFLLPTGACVSTRSLRALSTPTWSPICRSSPRTPSVIPSR